MLLFFMMMIIMMMIIMMIIFRAKNSVKHFPVKWDGKEFTFGFGRFASVDELAEHFASRPVIGGDSGKRIQCGEVLGRVGLEIMVKGYLEILVRDNGDSSKHGIFESKGIWGDSDGKGILEIQLRDMGRFCKDIG